MSTKSKEVKQNVNFDHVKEANVEAKKHQKSFNGVRSNLLSGKDESTISLNAFDTKVLKASKKDNAVHAYLKINSEMHGTFTNKAGEKVTWTGVWSAWSVLKCLRTLANDDDALANLALKF